MCSLCESCDVCMRQILFAQLILVGTNQGHKTQYALKSQKDIPIIQT